MTLAEHLAGWNNRPVRLTPSTTLPGVRPLMDIDRAIRERHTLKILGDDNAPLPPPPDEFAGTMMVLMQSGARAPYHYTCNASHQRGDLDSPVPWRFHALNGTACRRLMERVAQEEPGGKVARMLAVANGLILVTWLPDPPSVVTDPPQLFEPTRRNMEHIAATAAAIQNMLLTATAAGVHTFWSSGGLLRDPRVLDWLSVPADQVLLGALYLFPPEAQTATTKVGALRGRQGEPGHWMRWVVL